MDDPVVTGMRELALGLLEFPEKLQRRAMDKVMRRGGRYIVLLAKQIVGKVSGKLARSIRVTIVRDRITGRVTARVIAGRRVKKDDPYYALFVERGTKPHDIRPKGRKSLLLAGLFAEEVHHPGAQARPFLLPALEQGAQGAIEAMQDELAAQIELLADLRSA